MSFFSDSRIVALDWHEVVQIRMFGKLPLNLARWVVFVCDGESALAPPIPKECGKRYSIDVIPGEDLSENRLHFLEIVGVENRDVPAALEPFFVGEA